MSPLPPGLFFGRVVILISLLLPTHDKMNPLNLIKIDGVCYLDALASLSQRLDPAPFCAFVRFVADIDDDGDRREVASELFFAFDRKYAGGWIPQATDVVPVLDAVMQSGFDPSWRSDDGRTLLHYAAAFGDARKATKACQFLADKGVDPLATDKNGCNATAYAAESRWPGNSPLIDILRRPLTTSTHGLACALLKAGDDPNAVDYSTGDRPLHLLMRRQDGEASHYLLRDNLAEILLESGAHPNAPDARGRTVLHLAAASENSTKLQERLIAHGADPLICDKQGKTSADLAALPLVDRYQLLERSSSSRPVLDAVDSLDEIPAQPDQERQVLTPSRITTDESLLQLGALVAPSIEFEGKGDERQGSLGLDLL